MAKKTVAIAIVAFALGAALASIVVLKSCGPDKGYWVKRADYDARAQASDAQHKTDLATIEAATEIITRKDAEIAAILAAAPRPSPSELAKDQEIAALNAKVETLEAQGDVAGALAAAKTEISTWAEKFSLAERRHQDSLSALNNAWQAKFDAQVDISATWEAAYNREHGLRLTSDALRIYLEKKLYGGKFWKTLAIAEPPIFTAIHFLTR